MKNIRIKREVTTFIPNLEGMFRLSLYTNNSDEKEHLALIHGTVENQKDVLTRIHSECFTGDVLGSHRCDCNAQLHMAMEQISKADRGVLIYLRQEGRGIGLLNKLRTYELQDRGYDTVEANEMIGKEADERSYQMAARILEDLGIQSIHLLTNNPGKVEGLENEGIIINKRIELRAPVTDKNYHYLKTKSERLGHILGFKNPVRNSPAYKHVFSKFKELYLSQLSNRTNPRPLVTLSYAQSIDGSIASNLNEQTTISCKESLQLTHALRALHQGILVGIGTVLSDNPQLTVRLHEGKNPRAIILDSQLRIPMNCNLLNNKDQLPIIVTTESNNSPKAIKLSEKGVKLLHTQPDSSHHIDLKKMMALLYDIGIQSLMVEGGSEIITSFLRQQLVDLFLITISPQFLGGIRGVRKFQRDNSLSTPKILQMKHRQIGDDLIIWGKSEWSDS